MFLLRCPDCVFNGDTLINVSLLNGPRFSTLMLIRCGSHHDFLEKGLLLTRKLLNQGFLMVNLKSSLRKFFGHELLNCEEISVSQMTTEMFCI